jgi:hypothetical protein
MPKQHIPEPTTWLAELLAANYGRSSETFVYVSGRKAGLAPADIRRARRELGVEVWGKWWRLPRPPDGSTPIPAQMAALIPETHTQPRPEAGGHI